MVSSPNGRPQIWPGARRELLKDCFIHYAIHSVWNSLLFYLKYKFLPLSLPTCSQCSPLVLWQLVYFWGFLCLFTFLLLFLIFIRCWNHLKWKCFPQSIRQCTYFSAMNLTNIHFIIWTAG
jgi:hypothetical protein